MEDDIPEDGEYKTAIEPFQPIESKIVETKTYKNESKTIIMDDLIIQNIEFDIVDSDSGGNKIFIF